MYLLSLGDYVVVLLLWVMLIRFDCAVTLISVVHSSCKPLTCLDLEFILQCCVVLVILYMHVF